MSQLGWSQPAPPASPACPNQPVQPPEVRGQGVVWSRRSPSQTDHHISADSLVSRCGQVSSWELAKTNPFVTVRISDWALQQLRSQGRGRDAQIQSTRSSCPPQTPTTRVPPAPANSRAVVPELWVLGLVKSPLARQPPLLTLWDPLSPGVSVSGAAKWLWCWHGVDFGWWMVWLVCGTPPRLAGLALI